MDLGLLDHVKKNILDLIKLEKRIDNRKLLEFRKPISIIPNISKNAEGSCMVKWGNTVVMAGVKIDVGEPFPDTPDQGILIVNAEFLPGAHPTYEPGPPGPEAIELARVVDRTIRESEMIDLKKLVIKEGEKVWSIFIDIYVLNDDGNVIDPSVLASVVSLLLAKLPKYDEEKGKVIYGEKTDQSLPIQTIPISVTFGKIENKIILDPCKYEEIALDSAITISYLEKGEICSIQKYGSFSFSLEELDKIIEWGYDKSKILRRKIKRII